MAEVGKMRKDALKMAEVASKTAETPLCSVIIPVYNSGQSAVSLVKAIFQQLELLGKSADFSPPSSKQAHLAELFLIDDGSEDDTLKYLRPLKSSPEVKLRPFCQTHAGVSAARNLGLKHASGKYVFFLDSDDSLAPRFFETLLKLVSNSMISFSGMIRDDVEKTKLDHMYKTKTLTPKNNDTFHSYILRLLIKDGRLYPVLNKAFRLDIIKKHNLQFDEKLAFAEDLHFVLDYLAAAQKDQPDFRKNFLAFVPDPLYIYRYHASGASKKLNRDWQNWEKSLARLKTWLGPDLAFKEKLLLRLLTLRWHISCWKS